ncbi:MAG: PF20097 family protein [Candidatus Thorarchaeota archaeon]|jgi:hypothetical protein
MWFQAGPKKREEFSFESWDKMIMAKTDKESSYNICPACGGQMEHGYIVSNELLSWCRRVPSIACRCGERLDRAWVGCASLEGYRCRNCQIIRYLK